MEAPANNCKDPQRELPERYTPLVEYVSRELGGLNVAFDSACRRIESRRLLAEHKLRKTLQTYWSMNREDLNDLRPFDILHSFGGYAEATFKAAGEECVGMFSDAKAYRSFLFVAQEWVLENIVPKPQTLKQSTANLLKAVEGMRALAEQVLEFGGPQDRDMVPQLDAPIREIKESSVEIPDDPKFERVAELVLRTRIIGLRETFSAFEEGCPESAGDLLSWGGDWEQVLDDCFVDAFRMGSDSLGASEVASAFKLALRTAGNLDEAKEFWAVGLEQLHATLLAAWWSMSADARARDANIDEAITPGAAGGLRQGEQTRDMVPMPEEAVRAQLKTVTNKSEPDWPNGVLGTAGVATGRSTGRGFAPAPDLTPDGPGDAVPGGEKKGPKLNVALIKAWMDDEGWINETLAQRLKISERAVSSMRNNGEYHGAEAVAKLANLMVRDIVDLYLP